ncbi:MAG: tetratricopeptide repeat protein [Planctomycetota bacterium]|nr:tetratricopeptide repeat protein [Planctomycetota bacterium]
MEFTWKRALKRTGVALLCAAVLTLGTTRHAVADEIADAMAAMQREDAAAAHAVLVELVESEAVEPTRLFHAAWIALQLKDRDLLDRIRAVAETLEADDARDASLDLALGYAYLGLAEDQIRTGAGGSSTSLFFADAETRAKTLAAEGNASAVYLAARARYSQGDLPGAIAVLLAHEQGTEAALGATVSIQLGAYLYERGAATPAGADGRPTEAARADLARATALLRAGLPEATQFAPERRRQLRLTIAWSAHRLGQYDGARQAYLHAHEVGGETAALARRGLASLFARDAKALTAALTEAAAQRPTDPAPLDDLIRIHAGQKRYTDALLVIQQRIEAHPKDPDGYRLGGDLFTVMRQWSEAVEHYAEALAHDPKDLAAAFGIERAAQSLVQDDFDRALAIYERLLELRPDDPYCRNNLGFILREKVSPWTDVTPGGIQKLKADAPESVRRLLVRCRDAYAEAVARIPEAEDESRDMATSWNLAGIVNDYGLIIHYFADVQDAALAERMYHRALRMTEDAFKDTYIPNLQRLYAFVLKDRQLTWYRIARRCKDAILMERRVDGRMELVEDERKRRAAATDEARLRARIVQELGRDAAEDGSPWPPESPGGKDR